MTFPVVQKRAPSVLVQIKNPDSADIKFVPLAHIVQVVTSKSIQGGYGTFEITTLSNSKFDTEGKVVDKISSQEEDAITWIKRIPAMSFVRIFFGSHEDLQAVKKIIEESKVEPEPLFKKTCVMMGFVESINEEISNVGTGYRKTVTIRGADLIKPLFYDSLLLLGAAIQEENIPATGIVPVSGGGSADPQRRASLEAQRFDVLQDTVFSAVDKKRNQSTNWRIKLLQDEQKIGMEPRKLLSFILDKTPNFRMLYGLTTKGKTINEYLTINDSIDKLKNNFVSIIHYINFQGYPWTIFNRSFPQPILEIFGDTVGSKFEIVVRRPPFWRTKVMRGFMNVLSKFIERYTQGLLSSPSFAFNSITASLFEEAGVPPNPYTSRDEFVTEPLRVVQNPEKQYHTITSDKVIDISYNMNTDRIVTAYQTIPDFGIEKVQNLGMAVVCPVLIDIPASQRFGVRRQQYSSPWISAGQASELNEIGVENLQQQILSGNASPVTVPDNPAPLPKILTPSDRVATLLKPGSASVHFYVKLEAEVNRVICSFTNHFPFGQENGPPKPGDYFTVLGNNGQRLGFQVVGEYVYNAVPNNEVYQWLVARRGASASKTLWEVKPAAEFGVPEMSGNLEYIPRNAVTDPTLTVEQLFPSFTPKPLQTKANTPNFLALAARETVIQYFLNRDLSGMQSGSLTVVGDPMIRIGDRVYLPEKDIIAYVENVTNRFSYGDVFITTIGFSRGQPLDPQKDRLIDYDLGDEAFIIVTPQTPVKNHFAGPIPPQDDIR